MLRRIFLFWSDDRSLTVFLVLLVIYVFVISPEARYSGILGVISSVGLSVILAGGLFAMTRSLPLRALIAAFVSIFLAVHFVWVYSGGWLLIVVERVITFIFAAAMLSVVLWQVYKAGPVTGHRIRGAIAGYLMLAVIYSVIYSLIYVMRPDSFNFSVSPEIRSDYVIQDFFYFSVVTLTTLGYGDITPVNPLARTVVMVEAFTGQLYPAILIARLVSLAVDARTSGGKSQ